MTNVIHYVRTPVHDFSEEDRAFEALLKAGFSPERVRVSPRGDGDRAPANGHLPGGPTNEHLPRRRRKGRFPEACKYVLLRVLQSEPEMFWVLKKIRIEVARIGGHGTSSVGTELSKGCAAGLIARVNPSIYRLTDKGKQATPADIWK